MGKKMKRWRSRAQQAEQRTVKVQHRIVSEIQLNLEHKFNRKESELAELQIEHKKIVGELSKLKIFVQRVEYDPRTEVYGVQIVFRPDDLLRFVVDESNRMENLSHEIRRLGLQASREIENCLMEALQRNNNGR